MDKAQCTDKGSILPEGFSFDFIVKTSAIVTKTGSCLIDRVSCSQPEGHLSKNPGAWPETWRSSNSGAFIWKTREDPERMNWSSRQCSNQKEFYMFSQSIKMISPGTKEIDQKKKKKVWAGTVGLEEGGGRNRDWANSQKSCMCFFPCEKQHLNFSVLDVGDPLCNFEQGHAGKLLWGESEVRWAGSRLRREPQSRTVICFVFFPSSLTWYIFTSKITHTPRH